MSLLQPCPPSWVTDAMPAPHINERIGRIQVTASGSLALLRTVVTGAAAMSAEPLRAAVADAYSELRLAIERLRRPAIRFWNYLPDPAHLMCPGLDRYMVFNAGRFDGYGRHVATGPQAGDAVPTASAVGHAGSDLVIHCLLGDGPATPVENPRQTSSWHYSRRYGPQPPCFSRATVASVRGRLRLLIGGTASIIGEESCHAGDVDAQLSETLWNMATLVSIANGAPGTSWDALAALTDVRAYVVRPEDAVTVHQALERVCAGARMEVAVSRICRPELLVEIEGVAAISRQG